MKWTDDIRIETPELIDVTLEVAGLGSRFVAQVLDWAVKGGMLLAAASLVLIALALWGVRVDAGSGVPRVVLLAFLVVLIYVILIGYDIYFELRHNGQTPGKKQAGIRVILESGAPVDFRAACIRNLLAAADFLPAFYHLGSLLILLTPRNQRLGDLAAGTIVIRERMAEAPGEVEQAIERLASPEVDFTADQLAACQPEGRAILRAYFQRAPQLADAPRRQLAERLAHQFGDKTGLQTNPPLMVAAQAEVFLASLYRDLESLRQHEG
jgi:uncharacterized RDD family membrane protein YckC